MIARATHKKFKNLKNFELFDNEKSLGLFETNEKDDETETEILNGFVEMTGATKIVLVWTATSGKCKEEIVL